MPKTKGSTSYVFVKVGDLCKYLKPEIAIKVSRIQMESLNLLSKTQTIEQTNIKVSEVTEPPKPIVEEPIDIEVIRAETKPQTEAVKSQDDEI